MFAFGVSCFAERGFCCLPDCSTFQKKRWCSGGCGLGVHEVCFVTTTSNYNSYRGYFCPSCLDKAPTFNANNEQTNPPQVPFQSSTPDAPTTISGVIFNAAVEQATRHWKRIQRSRLAFALADKSRDETLTANKLINTHLLHITKQRFNQIFAMQYPDGVQESLPSPPSQTKEKGRKVSSRRHGPSIEREANALALSECIKRVTMERAKVRRSRPVSPSHFPRSTSTSRLQPPECPANHLANDSNLHKSHKAAKASEDELPHHHNLLRPTNPTTIPHMSTNSMAN
eukprot:m.44389 g.44389  ORF g.44389 m.44389 type:complete len:285 (-) comp19669_c0_seq1:33-887(-)